MSTDADAAPTGLDLAAVEPLLADRLGPREGGAYRATLVGGGKSNVTYLVDWADRALVIRRPPIGPHDPRNHDVGREYRVLSALAPTPLPTPQPILNEPTGEVIGVPFYVMERVDGRVLRKADDAPDMADPARLRRVGEALVDGLVTLHSLEPEAIGLGDLGKAQGYIERQVNRWAGQWERDQQRPIPALDEVGRRLQAALATGAVRANPDRPHLVHGDFNLGNVLIANVDQFDHVPVLRAVLDWEMATLGHPLMDLGVLIAYNGPHADQVIEEEGSVALRPGFPSPSELVELYGRRSGNDVSTAPFFEVLAMYKVLVITEDVRARYLAGGTVGAGFDVMGRSVPYLADALLETARSSSVPGLSG